MKIFLTGGAGYIGSAAAAVLLEAGHQVTVFDSLVTGYRAAVPDRAEFIEADLGDHEAIFHALENQAYDAVMHFAAFIEAGESVRDPGKYFENNTHNSLWLLEACAQAGVKRLVYSSSAAVYASSDEPLTEESQLKPNNPYGHTKLMVEGLLDWYRQVRAFKIDKAKTELGYEPKVGIDEGLKRTGKWYLQEGYLSPLVA